MKFNYKMIRLVLILTIIRNVHLKCNHSTTEPSNPTDNFKMNRQSTVSQAVSTTTMDIVTKISKGDCNQTFTGNSHKYGAEFFAVGLLVPYTIELSDVKEIKIFTSKSDVIAFTVLYNNGSSEDIGVTTNIDIIKTDLVNFENKELIAINIRDYDNIFSLQFLIHDLLDDTLSWTTAFGDISRIRHIYNHRIDYLTEVRRGVSNFKITKLYGSADDRVIKTFQVNYTYNKCNTERLETMPTPPIIATTYIPLTSFPICENCAVMSTTIIIMVVDNNK
jgi:hypothetical protein